MITLWTYDAGDRAEGDFWSDQFDDPRRRIDKMSKLIAVRGR